MFKDDFNEAIKMLIADVRENVPGSRMQSLIVTKLEEAKLWMNSEAILGS